MERKTPMKEQLKAFVAELNGKKEKLLHTMDNYGGQCAQELELLTRQVQETSAKLLLAENENDTASVKEYEGQIEKIKEQIAVLRKKSERYDGVGLEQLFINDFPRLKKLASDSRNERLSILADINHLVEEKNRQIQELKLEISILSSEQQRYYSDFEADCIAPIAAYMPGGDSLNPYISGGYDYTLRQQINQMLFK
jgi:phage host-nuclease inhibitor protein Gam